MMAAEQRFIYTGGGRDVIPRSATHVSVDESITVIPTKLFECHRNVVELICHSGVKLIEEKAFARCPRLRRVIIPGVEVVENQAFSCCRALVNVECDKLEDIRHGAFQNCKSLRGIKLPSAELVDGWSFENCLALRDAKFGPNLETIGSHAFIRCSSLESIIIPLKKGSISHDNIFRECRRLKNVDLVEIEMLDALLLEEWRNDMIAEVDSIKQILPNASGGRTTYCVDGEKASVIREWISRVVRKVIQYREKHRCLLKKAAASLQRVLPNDIVMDNVVPFLKLPSHQFGGEAEEDNGSSKESFSPSEDEGISISTDEEVGGVEVDSDDDSILALALGERVEVDDKEGRGRKRRKLTNDV